MKTDTFLQLRQRVIDAGYGEEIVWQEGLTPTNRAGVFFREYVWVVLSSGMKNQIARIIEDRIYEAWAGGKPTSSAFNHKGKVAAIDKVRGDMERYFFEYQQATDKLSYLASLPYIGNITKYHLAKNLGEDVVKPDRHLVRIAKSYDTTPFELCQKLSEETRYRIGTVDLIIWRAANLGFI